MNLLHSHMCLPGLNRISFGPCAAIPPPGSLSVDRLEYINPRVALEAVAEA